MNAEETNVAAAAEIEKTESDDLSNFDTQAGAEEGALMKVRNPRTGETMRFPDGTPFTIKFRGKDSAKIHSLSLAQQDKRIAHNMRTRQPVLASVVEKDNIELLVAATIEVKMLLDGNPVKNKPDEYRRLYSKFTWLFEQGDEFAGVRANFPTKSAPRSS